MSLQEQAGRNLPRGWTLPSGKPMPMTAEWYAEKLGMDADAVAKMAYENYEAFLDLLSEKGLRRHVRKEDL